MGIEEGMVSKLSSMVLRMQLLLTRLVPLCTLERGPSPLPQGKLESGTQDGWISHTLTFVL